MYLAAIVLMCAACGRRNTAGHIPEDGRDVTKMRFELPVPPAMMASEEERLEYVAEHYWDNFDFADTAYVNLPEITEQALADYLYLLQNVRKPVADKSLMKTLEAAETDTVMYKYFTDLLDKYLYEEGSPFRNEEMFIPVLRHMTASGMLDEYEKIRPQAQLEMALKNMVGDKASDVVVTLADGSKISLYGIKADYTLLYINNPDCTACAEITKAIKMSEDILVPLIRSGKLKVLAVYPDEDIEAWRNHRKDMPSGWLNGYDAGLVMKEQRSYNIRAIPTLYLLDKDKTVLLKDVYDVRELEYYFVSEGVI